MRASFHGLGLSLLLLYAIVVIVQPKVTKYACVERLFNVRVHF